jgi:hypothetical protein
LIVEKLRRKQQQRWTDTLASARPQIFPYLGNDLNAGNSVLPEFFLKRDEIIPQQIENFFSVDGGRCAQESDL